MMWATRGYYLAPLLLCTVLAKFGLPLGERGIPLAIVGMIVLGIGGVAAGLMRLDAQRLPLLLAVTSILVAMQVFQNERFRFTSFALLIALNALYALYSPRAAVDPARALVAVRRLTMFIGLCGIVQFASQFVIGSKWMFPIETLVPARWLIPDFFFIIPLSFGSSIYKSNGVFLLEPSFFSQSMAFGLLLGLSTRAGWRHALVCIGGLVVAYSGTGLLLLAICLPVLVIAERRWALVLICVPTAIALVALSEPLRLDVFMMRLGELASPRASGFHRFVGGFMLLDQFVWDDPWRTLFGYGAGSNPGFALLSYYPFAEMALTKLLFEFGIVGTLLQLGLLGACIFSSAAPLTVRLAVAVMYLLNGPYTPAAHGIALSMLVWPTRSRDLSDAAPGLTTMTARKDPARP